MMYTKEELKNAFCDRERWNKDEHGTKAEFIQAFIAKVDEDRELQISQIPTGREEVKRIGLNYLLEKERQANNNTEI